MKLTDNWDETAKALHEGLSGQKAEIIDALLKNQARYLEEDRKRAELERSWIRRAKLRLQWILYKLKLRKTDPYISDFQRIMIPMIRRIIPGTIRNDTIDPVRPIEGSHGLIYEVRPNYEHPGQTPDDPR